MALKIRAAFAEDKSLVSAVGPTFAITRTTAAKYRDNTGTVQTASSGEARFDHDASGTSLGLLIEPARTNIALHSNDWTNAVYDTVTNITPLKDATGPDGVANSASTLTATADNGVISQSITVASGEFTASVWMKRKTGTGTVEITDNGFTNATDITADINSSTWTHVGKITRTQANPVVGIRLGTSGDEVEVAYLQVEAGGISTSPIETGASSVARNADRVSATVTGIVNDTGYGSFYSSHTPSGIAATSTDDPGIWTLKDGVARIQCYYINSSLANFAVASFNTTGDEVSAGGGFATESAIGVEQKHVIGIAEDDVATYKNGEAGATDSTYDGHVLGSDWVLYLGFSDVGGVYLNGHIAEIRYYDERLDNTGLENLSNGLFPIPDVSGLSLEGATTLLLANGFAVASTTAESTEANNGLVTAQDGAAGSYVANGTTVTVTIGTGPSGNPGGWLNEYNAYKQRKREQERARKEILQKVRELDGIDGEIAELMQLDQAKEDEAKRIAEFRQLLESEISKAELDRAGLLNQRINRAYDRAMKKATFSAIEALEREIEDAMEEEEFAFLVLTLN